MVPEVSVIIPTHNRAEMVQRAIRSVLAQTWQGDMEIIVVSDGSTDNTEDVVNSFNDSRIRFFKHETSRGASAARNTGLRACRGRYIAFLDDDDEWTPDKLEVQMPVIESSPPEVGLVYAWMEYLRDGKSDHVSAPELRGDVLVEMLDKQAIGGCPTVIIKREVIDNVGYFDESLPRGNDGDYWRRISREYHVDYVPKVLAKVHVGHDDRISCAKRAGLKNEVAEYEKRLVEFSATIGEYPDKKASLFIKIGMDYIVLGRVFRGFLYLAKACRCNCDLNVKTYCFIRDGKRALRRLLLHR